MTHPPEILVDDGVAVQPETAPVDITELLKTLASIPNIVVDPGVVDPSDP